MAMACQIFWREFALFTYLMFLVQIPCKSTTSHGLSASFSDKLETNVSTKVTSQMETTYMYDTGHIWPYSTSTIIVATALMTSLTEHLSLSSRHNSLSTSESAVSQTHTSESTTAIGITSTKYLEFSSGSNFLSTYGLTPSPTVALPLASESVLHYVSTALSTSIYQNSFVQTHSDSYIMDSIFLYTQSIVSATISDYSVTIIETPTQPSTNDEMGSTFSLISSSSLLYSSSSNQTLMSSFTSPVTLFPSSILASTSYIDETIDISTTQTIEIAISDFSLTSAVKESTSVYSTSQISVNATTIISTQTLKPDLSSDVILSTNLGITFSSSVHASLITTFPVNSADVTKETISTTPSFISTGVLATEGTTSSLLITSSYFSFMPWFSSSSYGLSSSSSLQQTSTNSVLPSSSLDNISSTSSFQTTMHPSLPSLFTSVPPSSSTVSQSSLSTISYSVVSSVTQSQITEPQTGTTGDGVGTTTENSFRSEAVKDSNVSAVIGGVVGSAVTVCLVFGVWIILRRRKTSCFRSKKLTRRSLGEENIAFVTEDQELSDTRLQRPVKLSEFPSHFARFSSDSNLLFSLEYKDLGTLSPRLSTSDAEQEETRRKNRYTNILPFNKTRVKLLPTEDEPGSDYINANYVSGFTSAREYIATQGPIASTINDFWRMIWEQNVSIIVMLTQLVERGRKKCEPYWPDSENGSLFYGDIAVKLETESHLPDYVLRTFTLQLGETRKTVRQYYYLLWPDMGTPACTDYLLRFVKTVRNDIRPDMNGPIVVHCSAGVGRTGTFIALDTLMRKLAEGYTEIDIFGQVLLLRTCRINMVQTESQYIYLHECIRDHTDPPLQVTDNEDIYENVTCDSHF